MITENKLILTRLFINSFVTQPKAIEMQNG